MLCYSRPEDENFLVPVVICIS